MWQEVAMLKAMQHLIQLVGPSQTANAEGLKAGCNERAIRDCNSDARFIGPEENMPAPPRPVAALSERLPVGLKAGCPPVIMLLLCKIIIELYLPLSEAVTLNKRRMLDLPIFELWMPGAVPSALVDRRAEWSRCRGP